MFLYQIGILVKLILEAALCGVVRHEVGRVIDARDLELLAPLLGQLHHVFVAFHELRVKSRLRARANEVLLAAADVAFVD